VLKDILGVVNGPVNAEVTALDAPGMLKEGREYAKLHENIVVKIPMTTEGMKAVKTLTAEGIHTNVTLIFSPNQALLAAKAGASYASPFVGRLDDIATDGMHLIEEIVEIFDNYEFGTEVLVASVRGPIHIITAARMGADVCTCPPAVLLQCFKHPLTDIGLEKFLKDWEKAQAVKA
jgi:transaldolase